MNESDERNPESDDWNPAGEGGNGESGNGRQEQQRNAHAIYTTLFNRIIRNEYPNDTFLREDGIAREFSVSRTPIRNVLRRLEQDQLIELIPNRGARIFSFTADDLEDIYEIRKTLEVLALGFSMPALSIHRLIEIRNEVQLAGESRDYMVHARIDSVLHTYLIESCGRRRLITMVNQLYHLIQTFRELGFKDEEVRMSTVGEHLRLIDALCIRDADRAAQVLREHIQNSKIRILNKVINGQIT